MQLWILASLLTVGLGQLMGGYNNHSLDDPHVKDILDNLNKGGLAEAPNGFTLKAVQTQVVSGLNYRFIFGNDNGMTCEIVYYEQPWSGSQSVSHDTCKAIVAKQARRMLLAVGGYVEQNKTNPRWDAILFDLENTYGLIEFGNADVKIVDVATQVVSGENIRYTLLVGGKTCTLVVYEQTWTNTRKITSDTCGAKVTHKRQIGGGKAGGWVSGTPSQQKWNTMLAFLETNLTLINLNGGHDIEILAVKEQVVSGMNYNFTLRYHNHICNIFYYEQSWTNTHEIKYDSCSPKAVKRQIGGGKAGGWVSGTPSQQKWNTMLAFLETNLTLINLNGGHDIEILAVKEQVVSGMNYNFTLRYHNHICNIFYYEQSWTNTHEIKYDSCSPKAHKRSGEWKSGDPSDQKWNKMLAFMEQNLNLINLHGAHDFEVLAVKEQVVSGMNYNFTLRIHNHVCNIVYYEQSWTNTHEITSDSCHIKVQHKRQLSGGWKDQVSDQQEWTDRLDGLVKANLIKHNSWTILRVQTQVVAGLNVRYTLRVQGHECQFEYYDTLSGADQITTDTCGLTMTSHHVRQMSGGYSKQNASEPQWADLLRELDQQYHLIDLQGDNGLQVLGVETQVVSGMNYRFTLRVHGHVCNIVYYEQPWTKTREITSDTCHIKVQHKRQMPGGYSKQDMTTDPQKWLDLIQALDQQYHLIDLQGDNGLQVLGVSTQVVSGINYKFTLLVHGRQCELVYYEQVWTKTRQITQDTCGIKATHTKRFAFSSSTSGTQHTCLGAILDRINAQSNDMFRLVNAHDLQTQVSTVNGETSAVMRIQLAESGCMNDAASMGSTAEECKPNTNSLIHSVWEGKCKIHADGSPNEISVSMVSHK